MYPSYRFIMKHIELIVPIIIYIKMSERILVEVLLILNGGKYVK